MFFFSEFGQIFSVKISEKGLAFILDIAIDVPAGINVDELRLRQVMINLIGNAIKFTEKGHIKVKVYAENPQVIKYTDEKMEEFIDLFIEIEDTGIGISKESQDEVFEAFSQEQQDTYHEGTGLGLSITKRLVGLMNGTIQLYSILDKGSIFTIKLPGIACLSNIKKNIEEVQFDPDSVQFDEAIVIIADDVEYNRKYVSDVLKNTNITVIEAEDGNIAFELAKKKVPHLIIADIRMPNIDGFGLLDKIKGDDALKHIPVIAYSASVMKKPEGKNIQKPVCRFIGKTSPGFATVYRAYEIFAI